MSVPPDVLPTDRRWRLGPRATKALDAAIVLGLLALGALYVVSAATGIPNALTATVLSVAQTVPLWWRRRHPVLVFAAVVSASAVQVLALDEALPSQLAFPIAVYSVARWSGRIAGGVALAVSAVAAWVAAYDWMSGFETQGFSEVVTYGFFIFALAAVGWALGTLGRTREAFVATLVERADRVEREAAQQVELAASDERARIAREMHDVVAHGLTVMIVQADGARYAADPALSATALEAISTTGRESLAEMRRMLGLLRSDDGSGTRPQPILTDLVVLVDEARAAGMDLVADLPDPVPEVSAGPGLTAYRIVQEALTNVRKHAGPGARVHLEVRVTDVILIEVVDDGRGAAVVGDGRGMGLVGMRERAAVHGGDVRTGARAGGGFEVSARIPL